MSYYTRRSAAADSKPNVNFQQQMQQSKPSGTQYGGFVKPFQQTSSSNDGNKPLLNTPLHPNSMNTEYESSTQKTPTPPPAPILDAKPVIQTQKPPLFEEAKEQLSKMRSEHFQKLKEVRKRAGITKVDKKLKKRRLNARLEKVLKPKNAFLIFNELNLKPDYQIQENPVKGPGFCKTYTALLTLDGNTYHGESTSIMGAKMVAADVALKDWFMKSLKKEAENVEMKMEIDNVTNGALSSKTEPAPWSAVGSYAMHLLFTRWQMDMSNVNVVAPSSINERVSAPIKKGIPVSNKPSKTLRIVNELIDYTPPDVKPPANPEQCQPLYLFNLLFPNVPYVEKEDESNAEERFQLQCKINGLVYEARARNKKEVRKQIAMQVLANNGIKCGGMVESSST